MEYRGKKITALEIIDTSNNNEVIARICDNALDTINGYEVRIITCIKEETHI